MIIYGSTLSPFVRKVVAFAHEKGCDFSVEAANPRDPSPAFAAASPLHKIPAMEDGEVKLADSSAICHYLEAKIPDPALIPADAEARGRCIWYDELADTVVTAAGARMFFNRIVAPRFFGMEGDLDAAMKAEKEELPPILDYLETIAPDAGGYLVGDRLSLADLALASPFANFAHLGLELDRSRHGRILAWADSMLARPCFAASIEREKAVLAA